MDNNYRGVTPLKKRRNKITLNAAIVLCIIVFIIGILCGSAGTSGKQNQEAAKRIQEIEQEYEIEVTQLEKLNSDYQAELNKVKGELAQTQSKLAAIEKANAEAAANADPEVSEETAQEPENTTTEESETQKTGGLLKKIIVICLIIVIVLCILLGISIILKKNTDEDEDDEEEYDFDDDIEYIEEDYNDDEE